MTRAMLVRQYGGPEQLVPGEVELREVGPDQVLIRHTGIGVNFIDTYFRRGLYPIKLPAVIGDQASGVIEALGRDVEGFALGDRVAYCSSSGAYVERRVMRAQDVVLLPAGLSDEVVAATLVRGLTAEYLLFRLHAVTAGETVVVHAAAGGTGLLVCQWARHLGARVIGTVGDGAKMAMVEATGAAHVLLHSAPDFAAQVRELTDGRGADVVYDSIGRDTFSQSLECLRPRGLMVAYGNASGKPDPLDVLNLSRLGSLFLTRPRLNDYVATRAELEQATARYFAALRQGILRPHPVARFALSAAADAHRHLEDRAQHAIPILVP